MLNNNNENMNLQELPNEPLIHSLEKSGENMKNNNTKLYSIFIIVGVLSGFVLSFFLSRNKSVENRIGSSIVENADKKIVGSTDEKTFRDCVEGNMEAGGLDGEGTHKLIREGGESQTVYLVSSIVNLTQFEGKKVKICGETFAAKKAGWFMDVGRVETL
jgi:hypothetical protein